jgi:hypothetical protein
MAASLRCPGAVQGTVGIERTATDQVGGDGSCAAWRSRWSWTCISLRPSAFCSSRARAGGSPYRERPPSSETRVSLSQRRTLAGNRPCTGDGRSRWPGGKGGVPHSALALRLAGTGRVTQRQADGGALGGPQTQRRDAARSASYARRGTGTHGRLQEYPARVVLDGGFSRGHRVQATGGAVAGVVIGRRIGVGVQHLNLSAGAAVRRTGRLVNAGL